MADVVGTLDSTQLAAIRVARERQVSALRAGDWDRFMQSYDTHAVVMAPNSPPLDTHATIRAYLSSYPTIARIDLTEIEIEGRIDFAYERGQYDLVAGGITDQGSHFTLWRKQADGTWKIYRDMWHSDRPL
jgi:ketosteroid isomerase-like protein